MENKIRQIIKAFCSNLTPFTSLDVSNAVKISGFPNARHRDIAPIVRQIFCDEGFDLYGKTLIDVELIDGMKTKTNLYHHPSINPSQYSNRKQVALPPSKNKAPPAPPTLMTSSFGYGDSKDAIDDSNDDEDNDVVSKNINDKELNCYCKTDGRLEIPISWIRDYNWVVGYRIFFVLENDVIVVVADYQIQDDDTPLGEIVISSDNRIRIPKTVFMKAGYNYTPGSSHLIKMDDDSKTFIVYDN